MNRYDLVPARRSDSAVSQIFDWTDAIARRVIEQAARRVPTTLSERLLEEWMADLTDRSGRIARLRLALGCYWAAMLVTNDCCAAGTPANASCVGDRVIIADVRHGMSVFPKRTAASGGVPAVCEINTTPLIDVLLVLLVTLIITLPVVTHAVKLDLPQSPPRDMAPPEVINLDINFDGTILWNGSPVANLAQLEDYFRAESRQNPQPEIHLRPDPYVKYGVVAKVLAAAQHNRLRKLGFVNSAEFAQ
jgi:biopolymer transport protein ExbD